MERIIIYTTEGNLNRENPRKAWEGHTTEEASAVRERPRALKPETTHACGEGGAQRRDFTGFGTRPVKGRVKETATEAEGWEVNEGFRDTDLGGTQELRDTTPTAGTNGR